MSELTVDELRKQLSDQLETLAKKRKEETEQMTKEKEEKLLIEQAERAEKIRIEREKQSEHKRRVEAERVERESKIQKETAERLEFERKQNETEELNRQLREKLEYIQNEIHRAEFVEEQHRKTRENNTVVISQTRPTGEINVEYPTAPLNANKPGEAVDGTDGLETGPLMSQHLKHILRQASRA